MLIVTRFIPDATNKWYTAYPQLPAQEPLSQDYGYLGRAVHLVSYMRRLLYYTVDLKTFQFDPPGASPLCSLRYVFNFMTYSHPSLHAHRQTNDSVLSPHSDAFHDRHCT
jgi:hypothetical protein